MWDHDDYDQIDVDKSTKPSGTVIGSGSKPFRNPSILSNKFSECQTLFKNEELNFKPITSSQIVPQIDELLVYNRQRYEPKIKSLNERVQHLQNENLRLNFLNNELIQKLKPLVETTKAQDIRMKISSKVQQLLQKKQEPELQQIHKSITQVDIMSEKVS